MIFLMLPPEARKPTVSLLVRINKTSEELMQEMRVPDLRGHQQLRLAIATLAEQQATLSRILRAMVEHES